MKKMQFRDQEAMTTDTQILIKNYRLAQLMPVF